MMRIQPTPGGWPISRLSANVSGLRRPSLKVRTESCIAWLLPYSGDRSRYDDVLFLVMSV